MKIVTELISGAPLDRPDRIVERDESKLFEAPPPPIARFLKADRAPLAVHSFPASYEPTAYSPPRGVFEGAAMRLEWQMINGRQPFYHRNSDVDEVSFQVSGERTLMTECGTVEMRPGQLSVIPAGVAHDNYARDDVHLLFYIPGPARPCVTPIGYSEHRIPPFDGWQPANVVEMISDNMGGPGTDIAHFMADETLLLNAAARLEERIELIAPQAAAGTTEWLYKAPGLWIGHTLLERTIERSYVRRTCADEIQYQVEGERTLITQRGVVTLAPGEFTCIPLGAAFASVTSARSRHLSVLTTTPAPAVREPSRLANTDIAGSLQRLAESAEA